MLFAAIIYLCVHFLCVYVYQNLNLFSLDSDQIIFRRIKKEEKEKGKEGREGEGGREEGWGERKRNSIQWK